MKSSDRRPMYYLAILLLLGSELLAERCRTDDLMPSIPISCLPPCCMDPKVQGLDILINQVVLGRPTGLLCGGLLVVLEQQR